MLVYFLKHLKENVSAKKQKNKPVIFLNQNITNNVYLTLSESVTLTASSVYFLFRFSDETTKREILFTAPDQSTNTVRYNLFDITLTAGTENFTAGTISMQPAGKWIYQVYEMTGQTNLSLSGTSGIVIEEGFVQLSGTPNSMIVNSYNDQAQTYTYYLPE